MAIAGALGRRRPSAIHPRHHAGRRLPRRERCPPGNRSRPRIGPGEILVRVHSCGVCGTDLKKISTGSHSAPRIFGHETSGKLPRSAKEVRNSSPAIASWSFITSRAAVLLLPEQDVCPVRHLQESRLHRRVRALGRRFRRIRPRNGLDRRAAERSASPTAFPSSRLVSSSRSTPA